MTASQHTNEPGRNIRRKFTPEDLFGPVRANDPVREPNPLLPLAPVIEAISQPGQRICYGFGGDDGSAPDEHVLRRRIEELQIVPPLSFEEAAACVRAIYGQMQAGR